MSRLRLRSTSLSIVFVVIVLSCWLAPALARAQGVLTSGADQAGAIPTPGATESWTFTATAGESFLLSVAHVSGTLMPFAQIFDPNGTNVQNVNGGSSASHSLVTAGVTGTYTVVVRANPNGASATGTYILRLVLGAGPFTVPSGDEGGPMTNGANHTGFISLGDLDVWSFDAAQGDGVVISLTDADDVSTFVPSVRIFSPTGAYLGSFDAQVADVGRLQATVAGTYLVVVSSNVNAGGQTGNYIVRLAKNPGSFVTPTGDEGGALINGADHPGFLANGDLDLWSFTANQGDGLVFSLTDTDNNANFIPQLHVFGPTGQYLAGDDIQTVGFWRLQAPATGTYLAVVSPSINGSSSGNYLLRMARGPAAFVIPSGDQGGTLRNGEGVTGQISIGDLDIWTFVATAASPVTVTLANPDGGSTFTAAAEVFGPNGAYLFTNQARAPHPYSFTATQSGRYTVVVSSSLTNPAQIGPYSLDATGIQNDLRGTTTAITANPAAIAAGATATVTAVVTDIDVNTTSNPAGQVTFGSAVAGDGFTPATCLLAAVPATINESSCQATIAPATSGARVLSASYGGSGTHAPSGGTTTLTVGVAATTTNVIGTTAPFRDNPQTITLTASVTGAQAVTEGTVTFTLKDGVTTIGTPVTSAPVTNGSASVGYIVPGGTPAGTFTIVADYSGGASFGASSGTGALSIVEQSTYSLAEGATSAFFHTDILLANPNASPAPVQIDFLKEDGSMVTLTPTLLPTSRTTIDVGTVPGMAATSFSTVVTSIDKLPLVVERTMHWDASDYGSSTEKANEGVATTWYFAEGSQGFFHTFFLLLNPQASPNVAHVTYVFEDATSVERDYPLAPTSRFTVDAAADPALINRSFGATVVFDLPGMAERSMYFGASPLWSGGTAAAGVTAPATTWQMAEGATGSFFNTFVLIANPNPDPTTATMTYLLDNGGTVVRQHTISGHQRLTINVALEDPSLASAAFGTLVQADRPVVVERSQYWPVPNWIEAHNSMAVYALGTKWGLAEGRVGGPAHAQTYVLVANPNPDPAQLTVTFLRSDGSTLVKHFTVGATSRFNISVTGAGTGQVPELNDESFGTVIESSQPVLVERSMYTDANGITWAAGTNATGTRLP